MPTEPELFIPNEKPVSKDRQRAIHLYLVLEDMLTDLNTINAATDSRADIAKAIQNVKDFASCVIKAEKDILEDE